MQHDFWHTRWQNQQIGFHLDAVNPLLAAHFQTLDLQAGQRVFIPLCGKTLDIHWLLSQDMQVAGAELNQLAVDSLFTELGITPTITQRGSLRHYSAEHIDIFQGDFFELDKALLGDVDAIYDRAALIALPQDIRAIYSQRLIDISHKAPQFLITFHYDKSLVAGPPFNVDDSELITLYSQAYSLDLLAEERLPTGLKGQYPAQEKCWLLRPLS
ncbi:MULTISPECIES: thiopurine S-methyltransferase [unclassified Methylophilus]|uniref:thiopurine S-methyltransferase n=1 Tax=unclassified Methylophilus TaxID=2630143 RepID=UPI0006F359A6|nr:MULTISPECIES: thiopurine S-methyltransferase [unclassified Methylophilus]KQT41228.1 thiopurine S-methyltransferase [Methylophilus sp. Leaf416]KQT57750.1 thiopurine S-methyltransferase [Methylophilus sp. Leaf459]